MLIDDFIDGEFGFENTLLALSAVLVYAIFLLSVSYLFRKYLYNFDDTDFVKTYGALTDDLRKVSWWPLTFVFVFILRRALMVVILVQNNI